MENQLIIYLGLFIGLVILSIVGYLLLLNDLPEMKTKTETLSTTTRNIKKTTNSAYVQMSTSPSPVSNVSTASTGSNVSTVSTSPTNILDDLEYEYTEWTDDGECSKTCGGGLQFQKRRCLREKCAGVNTRSIPCNNHPCPIDGGFSDWKDVEPCSKSCDGGTKKQIRTCDNPAPQFGGKQCDGTSERTVACNTHVCPPGTMSDWSDWTPCGTKCSTSTRTRKCLVPPCTEPLVDKKTCAIDDSCWFQLRDQRFPKFCLMSKSQTNESSRGIVALCTSNDPATYWKFETDVNGNTVLRNKKWNKCFRRIKDKAQSNLSTCDFNDGYQQFKLNSNGTLENYGIPLSDKQSSYKCAVNRSYQRPPVENLTMMDFWTCDNNAELFTKEYPIPS